MNGEDGEDSIFRGSILVVEFYRREAHVKAILILLAALPAFAIDLFDTPPVSLRPYSTLYFPPQLPKAEVAWMLQTAADALDQRAFVDMGDQSDFMHMHLVLRSRQNLEMTPEKPPTDLSWTPPWAELVAVAALIHTQEYEGARNRRPYRNRAGEVISSQARNQLLLLRDSVFGKRGAVIPAYGAMQTIPQSFPYTVRTADLAESFAGPNAYNWEFSFYFYRVKCAGVDELRARGVDVAGSNTVELRLNGERACFNLMHFYCRNHPEDQQYCGGGFSLEPYFQKDGPRP